MIVYKKDEISSVTNLAKNFSTLLDNLLKGHKEKLVISKNNELKAVIIPIEEYEEIKKAYIEFKNIKKVNIDELIAKIPSDYEKEKKDC